MRTRSFMQKGWIVTLLITTALLLDGCGRTAPVSYYQLTPARTGADATDTRQQGSLIIGIGPVRLQEYLDRQQLVTRANANRLHLADRHRWSEPLADNIAWVLRDNLSVLLATEHILLHPWEKPAKIDLQLSLDILRCEEAENGSAELEAIWTVRDGNNAVLIPPRRSSYLIAPAAPGPDGLTQALSEALARLSEECAGAIAGLRAGAAT